MLYCLDFLKYYTKRIIDVVLMLNILKDAIMCFLIFLSSMDSVLLCDYTTTFCGWTTIYILYNITIINIPVHVLCCRREIVLTGYKLCISISIFSPTR